MVLKEPGLASSLGVEFDRRLADIKRRRLSSFDRGMARSPFDGGVGRRDMSRFRGRLTFTED
jgi:hypothetical protein